VETCTTSHFDSSDWTQPLLCPHGYTCHILDLGDPTNGVPNRGHCVKESHTHKTHAHGPVWHFRIRTGKFLKATLTKLMLMAPFGKSKMNY
jgi:hypothetical protein